MVKEKENNKVLKYQSLMTSSNIASCLAEMEEKQKPQFLALMLKLDIKIGLIKGDYENYYKIWILRKDRKKKVFITDYHHKPGSATVEPRLQDILATLRDIVDVPKTYEEYCMEWFPQPLKEDHLEALEGANRFEGVLDRSDVKSIPLFKRPHDPQGAVLEQEIDDSVKELIQNFKASEIKRYVNTGFTTIRLHKLSEYNYLLDLCDNIKRLEILLKRYGFDDESDSFIRENFPVPRSDKELEGIKNDIDNFNNEVKNSYKYLEDLAARQGKKLSSIGAIVYPPSNPTDKRIKSTGPIIIKYSNQL